VAGKNKPDRLKDADDQHLIKLSQKGSKEAFGVLVERYMRRAYYVALGFVGSHEDALDLSQEAFVRSYRAIRRFELGRKFFTWYYQILRNLCFNFLRGRRKAAYSFSELPEHEVLQFRDERSEAPDQMVEKKELLRLLWQAIQALSESDREIVLLRDIQGLSYQEISDTLECPIGTVMSRLYYARQKLAAQMKELT
jgi:RNA polymerase sigma-70 factor (ECF subfamily)